MIQVFEKNKAENAFENIRIVCNCIILRSLEGGVVNIWMTFFNNSSSCVIIGGCHISQDKDNNVWWWS